jgi:hypothetical protein
MSLTRTIVGLNLLRDANQGAGNPEVGYIALGDGAAGGSGSTTLTNERFRKKTTSFAVGSTGVITAQIYIEPTEAVGVTFSEIGVFIGDDASSTANSGTLLALGAYSPTHTKTSTESGVMAVQITYS